MTRKVPSKWKVSTTPAHRQPSRRFTPGEETEPKDNVRKYGTGKDSASKNGTSRKGADKKGTDKKGTGKKGTGKNGTTKNGTGKDGSGKNGIGKSGVRKYGARKHASRKYGAHENTRKPAAHKQLFFRFLALPAELRLRVYSHLLLADNGIAIDIAVVWNRVPKLVITLLCVNKQIYAEASHYLYSANTFTLLEHCNLWETDRHDPPSHPAFPILSTLPRHLTSHIRSLHLRLRTERPVAYYTSLLSTLASTLTPNLVRIALTAERRTTITLPPLPPTPSNPCPGRHAQAIRRIREPNMVVGLSKWAVYRLKHSLANFQNLQLVVFGGRQEEGVVEEVWEFGKAGKAGRTGGGWRVQGLVGRDAERRQKGGVSVWEGEMWVDLAPTAVRVRAGRGRNRQEGQDGTEV